MIRGLEKARIEAILDFLTLKQEGLMQVEGESSPAKDLPVWEHLKRLTKYTLKPLIDIEERYVWGPHSVDRSLRSWMRISSTHRLPADIRAPSVTAVLNRGHKALEEGLEIKGKEIVERHTRLAKREIYPHLFDSSISDIGDYDILAYLEDKNLLLNIESKIIDSAFVLKDLQRIQRKIFGRTDSNGNFKKGYLQKVETRADYLDANYANVMVKQGWSVPSEKPKVISVFLTRLGDWWTKFPPVATQVDFVELRLLDQFIAEL